MFLSNGDLQRERASWELKVLPGLGTRRSYTLDSRIVKGITEGQEGIVRAIGHLLSKESKFRSDQKVLKALNDAPVLSGYFAKGLFQRGLSKTLIRAYNVYESSRGINKANFMYLSHTLSLEKIGQDIPVIKLIDQEDTETLKFIVGFRY